MVTPFLWGDPASSTTGSTPTSLRTRLMSSLRAVALRLITAAVAIVIAFASFSFLLDKLYAQHGGRTLV